MADETNPSFQSGIKSEETQEMIYYGGLVQVKQEELVISDKESTSAIKEEESKIDYGYVHVKQEELIIPDEEPMIVTNEEEGPRIDSGTSNWNIPVNEAIGAKSTQQPSRSTVIEKGCTTITGKSGNLKKKRTIADVYENISELVEKKKASSRIENENKIKILNLMNRQLNIQILREQEKLKHAKIKLLLEQGKLKEQQIKNLVEEEKLKQEVLRTKSLEKINAS